MAFDARGFFRSATRGTPTSSDIVPFLDAEAGFQVKGSTLSNFRKSVSNFIDMRDWVGYDLTGNNASDSYITEAISQASTNGGGTIWLGAGLVTIESNILINNNQITLQGAGGVIDGNILFIGGIAAARAAAATRVVWGGAGDGEMITFSPADTGSDSAKNGGGIQGVLIDGNNLAGCNLHIKSWRNAKLHDTTCIAVRTGTGNYNFKLGTITNNVTGGNKSAAYNDFRNFWCSNKEISSNAKTMLLYGHITDGNAALNSFVNCGWFANIVNHIDLENCDSNVFTKCNWGGSMTLHADDTGSYSTSSSVARHNQFLGIQGHIVAKETVAGTVNSHGNIALGYSRENGVAEPTVEEGADFSYISTAFNSNSTVGHIHSGQCPYITELYMTSNQTIPTGTITTATLNNVGYDFAGAADAVNYRITVPANKGIKWVKLTAGVKWASNNTGVRFVGIGRNLGGSSGYQQEVNLNASDESQTSLITRIQRVNEGDYFWLDVKQTSGGNLDLIAATKTFLQAEFY